MSEDKKVSSTETLAINKEKGLSPTTSGTPMPAVKPAAESSNSGATSSSSSTTEGKK